MPKELMTGKMMMGDEEVVIDGYVHYHTEAKWGADADGNRGVKRTFVDDVTNINIYSYEGDDVKFTADDENRAADILGTKFLEG